jgi:hydrogenase nickel insertion protein HypA
MHDLWFAGKIIVSLKEKIGYDKSPGKITVNVSLGPFTHVTKESLVGAFKVLNEEAKIRNVSLNVKKNSAVVRCKECGAATEISGPVTGCPKCNSADFDLENIEEFKIESIEIE